MSKLRLKQGDCIAMLRSAPADYVDSIVTDPPAGISFMGKEWDSDKGGRDAWVAWMTDVMRECHRVLKPGGHALVWAIPRTSHWTATALENAGFEIRDCITHLFGQGFPKSMDISKAIDKAAGAEREVVGSKVGMPGYSLKANDTDEHSRGAYSQFKDAAKECAITAPATDAAKQWEGWGTALKPASEHWILCRKPLSEKTVAANVLKHGTGGLNIDGCRIAAGEDHAKNCNRNSVKGHWGNSAGNATVEASPLGRFPANLILSHNDDCDAECTPGCAVAELDRQSGVLKSGGGDKSSSKMGYHGGAKGCGPKITEPSEGGASRFFYCAKAPKKDKGDGNTHPTVKSTKLMEYLIRLITPPGGVVLDPFMGSGTTGVAAVREGFGFVGVEADATYFEIASGRIKAEDRSA